MLDRESRRERLLEIHRKDKRLRAMKVTCMCRPTHLYCVGI